MNLLEVTKVQAQKFIKKIILIALFFSFAAIHLRPCPAFAKDSEKTVRVGWYDSSYNTIDRFGRRTGYAYEYQLKISSYTGWTYEYINGSWPDLLALLKNGEIDLMSDVSYTEERTESMLFPDLPMGAEEYYLFISPGNRNILANDYSTLNGKKVGVNKDSVQASFYREWAARNGIEADLLELTCSEDDSVAMLESGELDAYVTVDAFTSPGHTLPVWKVGSSDFFFAVSKDRPDLLTDLNYALAAIREENSWYNQLMSEKYIRTAGHETLLSQDELNYLASHETIKVGYQDNYLAFCAGDKATGELTGALKDYLSYAEECLNGVHLSFEPIAYPTVEKMMDALTDGETDCIFPACFGGYESEKMGIMLTPSMMNTDIYAIVRENDLNSIKNREHVLVAVDQGNPNYDSYLLDHYPDWNTVYFNDTEECLKAVSDSLADCVLVSGFRYNHIARLCDRYNLTMFPTVASVDYCMAVRRGNTELYSILAKVIEKVPVSTVNSALSHYVSEDAKPSFRDFLSDNIGMVLLGIAVLIFGILLILFRSLSAQKKAKRLIAVTEVDSLTGIYNRDYFFQYTYQKRAAHPDRPMDAAVLDIEQFHSINALKGRKYGDQILRVLGNEIRILAENNDGIAGRSGADRFYLYCRPADDYRAIYEGLQKKLENTAPNSGIRLRMGVMPWQKDLEPVQMFDRARTACSMARGHYKEHLIIFDEKLQEREFYNQRLLGDLQQALENYEFEVYYQPKYDIREDPPKLVSAEALIRWHHPELGIISPGDFIPLFERSGKIEDVDKYVWNEAARRMARWKALYGLSIPISVNLSRIDIFDPMLMKTLEDILTQNGLPHDALKLEVTESAYLENADQLIRVVQGLRENGYTVEMDDFGTGYSSLNMLSAMPIDVIKMDRTFILDIENDEKDVQLVALILGIAKNLNVPVIAEGVETEAQLNVLKELGCSLVQGYYFSKPLHPSEFEREILKR